jgi:hypothetical protein
MIRSTRDARAVEQAAPKAASSAHGGHASAGVATPARPRCAGGGGRKPPLQRDRAVVRPRVFSVSFQLLHCVTWRQFAPSPSKHNLCCQLLHHACRASRDGGVSSAAQRTSPGQQPLTSSPLPQNNNNMTSPHTMRYLIAILVACSCCGASASPVR